MSEVKKKVSNQKVETEKSVKSSSIKNGSILTPNALDSIPKKGLFHVDRETNYPCFKSPTGVEFLIGDFRILARVKTTKNGKEQISVYDVCSRLDVVAEASDKEGEGYCRVVRFVDSIGRKHEKIISRGDIATSPSKVVNGLVSSGLSVYSLSQNVGNKYLVDYLNNCPTDKHILTVDSYGWVELGKTFIIPHSTISLKEGNEIVFNGDTVGAPAYDHAGTLDQWKETIGKDSRHSSRVALGVCIALASPLLEFTNEQSGGFHIVGKTSKGKTTAIRAGVSVWAKVIEGKGEMACSWSGTSNGLEMACKNHTNLPLFLDEIGRSEESKLNLESLLYTLGNGAGKARMSQDIKGRPIASWNLLALSTGEKTPRDVVQELGRDMATGADVRMAVIQAQPVNEELGVFETLPNDNDSEPVVVRAKKLAERFAHYGAQYYGTAGIAFIKSFIQDVDQRGGVQAMKEYLAEKIEAWMHDHTKNHNAEVLRVARRFALVAVAGELATEYGVLPWNVGEASKQAGLCFQSFIEGFETAEDRQKRLCSEIFDYVVAYPENFDSILAPNTTIYRATNPRPFCGTVIYTASPNENVRGEPVVVSFTDVGFVRAGGKKGETSRALVDRKVLITSKAGKGKKPCLKYQTKNGSLYIKVGGISLPRGYLVVAEGAFPEEVNILIKGSILEAQKREQLGLS